MDSHWVNRRPGYRCRHGHTSAQPRAADHPSNLYIREDDLLTSLTSKLSHLAEHRNPTIWPTT